MGISLYDVSVADYLQTLEGVVGVLAKGLDHFTANKVDLAEIVETRVAPDMLPFRFQLQSVAHHSLGAIEGVKKGLFEPPPAAPAHDCRGLRQLVGNARDALQKVTSAEVNALEGKDVVFQFRDFEIPFTAEGFILSFSLPNFYFHATTAYDILRMRGVPIGKRDYMGPMRLKSRSGDRRHRTERPGGGTPATRPNSRRGGGRCEILIASSELLGADTQRARRHGEELNRHRLRIDASYP